MPFQVDINSSLDQVCIIFYPSALRAFTTASYDDLMCSDSVFETVFSKKNTFVLEQLFEEEDFNKRTEILEALLLKKLNNEIPYKLKEALHLIATNNSENFSIETLAKTMEVSDSSLFRLFKNNLGQNPKSYLKTVRFRNILDEIKTGKHTHTEIETLNQYYDQAHFIKDFKIFTGNTPKKLIEKVSVQQEDLTWIYNKK